MASWNKDGIDDDEVLMLAALMCGVGRCLAESGVTGL